jgi:hypothetical protein
MSVRYTNIEQIKAANTDAGDFWFSPSTIRFFDGRVESRVYDDGKGHRLWVDSIQDHGRPYVCPREYKIAQFNVSDADITRPETPGTGTWRTAAEAEQYLTENLL